MQVNDAVRPAGSWGILRVRAIEGERVLVQADDYAAWLPMSEVEYLHTPHRWVDMEYPTNIVG